MRRLTLIVGAGLVVAAPLAGQRIGGLEVAGAVAESFAARYGAAGGGAVRLSLSSGGFSLGPEAMAVWGSNYRAQSYALLGRIELIDRGVVRPHLAVGAGYYVSSNLLTLEPGGDPRFSDAWSSRTTSGVSVGGGVTIGSKPREHGVIIEARFHTAKGSGPGTPLRNGHATLTAGYRFTW